MPNYLFFGLNYWYVKLYKYVDLKMNYLCLIIDHIFDGEKTHQYEELTTQFDKNYQTERTSENIPIPLPAGRW